MHHLPSAGEILETIGGTDDAIARRLAEYGLPTRQSTVNRWRRGAEPDGYRMTLALLEMAGRLRSEAAAPQPTVTPSPPGEDRLGVIEEALADVLDNQARALQVLGVPPAELVRPERLPSRHAADRKKKKQ